MRFDRYILWCQSTTPTDEDTIIVDGSQPTGTVRDEAFSFLNTGNFSVIDGVTHIWHNIKWKRFINHDYNHSSSFAIYCDKSSNLLIKSHFKDLDNSGRRIVYMFCLRGRHLSTASSILLQAAKDIGKECNPGDIELLEHLTAKLQLLKYLLYILGITAIIAIIFALKAVMSN